MADAKDKNLSIIEKELAFIGRQAQHIEVDDVQNLDRADDIGRAVASALQALEEYKLSLQPACEEIPEPLAA